jgi:hypothetical protein
MAFFAESTYEESYQDLGIVVNDYTDFDALALEACDVVQEMDNAIMQGIGKYELTTIREGAEVVYTEGMMDSIKSKIEKIWTFIKNWVKNVWNKFIAWLESYVRGDKAFLSKYKKKLDENLVYLDKDFDKTFKYAKIIEDGTDKAFTELDKNFTNFRTEEATNRPSISDKTSEEASNRLEKLDDLIDEIKDEYKDAEFEVDVNANWVRSHFSKILDMVKEDASKYKREQDKAFKDVEQDYKSLIKDAESKNKGSEQPAKSNYSAYTNYLKSASTKYSNLHTWKTSFKIKCIKGAKSDARALCRAILTAKPNPKYNESAFDHNDFEAYFNI